MDPNLNGRLEYLQSLGNFISESYERLKHVTDSLGWDLEQSEEEREEEEEMVMVSCPLNPEHRTPVERLEAHLESCRWKQEGYGPEDVPLPPGSRHRSSPTTITIDGDLEEGILLGKSVPAVAGGSRPVVAQTADRMRVELTPAQRLALYDYAVANTRAPAVLRTEELSLTYKKDEDESRPKSKLELLMEMRDAKRRRVSYRTKKVHTNRKSHLEILREVINNQMEFLEESGKLDETDERVSTPGRGKDDRRLSKSSSDGGVSTRDRSRPRHRSSRWRSDGHSTRRSPPSPKKRKRSPGSDPESESDEERAAGSNRHNKSHHTHRKKKKKKKKHHHHHHHKTHTRTS